MQPCQEPVIIFFGTPEFGAIVLERLAHSPYAPALVVTAPDKPSGRNLMLTPPPVKVLAEQYTIPVLQHSDAESLTLKIKNLIPDLFVVASYGQILPKEILAIPKYGVLNVHPSLLPRYRGSSPVHAAMLRGDTTTGVTIMLMDEKVDHGPILSQRHIALSPAVASFHALHDALAREGSDLLVETIPRWIAKTITPLPQDHAKATYTARIKKEDGRIDWNNSATDIERQIRAFERWPESFTTMQGKTVKILEATIAEDSSAERPRAKGEIFRAGGGLAIQTGNGVVLIGRLQVEGKRAVSGKEFLLGHPSVIGTIAS